MSDLPRILLCSFDVVPGPTGSSRRLTEYVKGLSDRFQVVVLTAKTPDHSHIERYHGARLLRVPVGGGDLAARLMAFDRAVRRQLESEEYVLAHFTDPFGGYAPCEHKGDYGFRVVYEAHGFPSQELRYTHPQTEGDRRFLARVRRQELFCLMNADLVITGSETTRRFIQGLGVPGESLRVLRAPVDLAPYSPAALGQPDGSPMRLVFLGSQVGYQGLPTLLRAMQHACRQTEVRLAIVGPKHLDWQPHLEHLVDELHLAGKVEFQPPVNHDDLFKVMAAADVGVLPLDDLERNRKQGGALAKASEYLASGRPVIAADLPVTRELLPESTTLFYPPGDFAALGERIVQLSQDPALRVQMGASALEVAARCVDASDIRGKLIDFYDGLLGQAAARGTSGDESSSGSEITATNRVRTEDSDEVKVPKTDPAFRKSDDPESEPTDPTSLVPLGPVSSPAQTQPIDAVGLPILLGEQIPDRERQQASGPTEPDARGGNEMPVIMGLPVRDDADAPVVLGTALLEAEPPPPRAAPEPGFPTIDGLEAPETDPSVPVVDEPLGEPPRPYLAFPSAAALISAARPVPLSNPSEDAHSEGEPLSDFAALDATPRPGPAPEDLVVAPEDEAEEISSDEIEELEEGPGGTLDADEPSSHLEPWFAQLAHGYCPPEGAQFARHAPPTSFPGRDDIPGPSRLKP